MSFELLTCLFQVTEFSTSINEELREIYPTISINKVKLRSCHTVQFFFATCNAILLLRDVNL